MKFPVFAKQLEKLIADNSPVILTAVGVIGVIGTSVLAHQAAVAGHKKIVEYDTDVVLLTPEGREPAYADRSKKVALTWKLYIPVAASGALTIASIVCANRISAGRAAALAAAYSLNEKRFVEYREKVLEKFKEPKAREVDTAIAEDQVKANPPDMTQFVMMHPGDMVVLDQPTGQFFKGDMQKIRRIENDINQQVVTEGFATLNDLQFSLGIKPSPYSEALGWLSGSTMLEVRFSSVLSNETAIMCINYTFEHIRGENQEAPPF